MKKEPKGSLVLAALLTVSFVLLATIGITAQEHPERETFQATAMGTGTQLGRMASVNIIIEEYSTAEDQQILFQAFDTGGMKGLCHALSKMKSKGRLAITGTLGYDVTYIVSFPTANGRKIRLVTNRAIRFGEAWTDSRSMDYSLSALELDLTKDKGEKSTGVLMPACELKIGKDKQLKIEAYQNPWNLVNIQDR